VDIPLIDTCLTALIYKKSENYFTKKIPFHFSNNLITYFMVSIEIKNRQMSSMFIMYTIKAYLKIFARFDST
jgi:uncharacterized membrane protein (GlpM family)